MTFICVELPDSQYLAVWLHDILSMAVWLLDSQSLSVWQPMSGCLQLGLWPRWLHGWPSQPNVAVRIPMWLSVLLKHFWYPAPPSLTDLTYKENQFSLIPYITQFFLVFFSSLLTVSKIRIYPYSVKGVSLLLRTFTNLHIYILTYMY